MCPKFRGGSDDWMDDEGGASGRRAPSKARKGGPKAETLPPEDANAVVAEIFPKQCRVLLDDPSGPHELLCSYKRSSVIDTSSKIRERSPVAVGDRVLVKRLTPQDGIVEGICERRNRLWRPAPGRDSEKIFHVVAANIDDLVIVCSAVNPEFSHGIVDRYLIAASAAGIKPVICVTKLDLWSSEHEAPWAIYRELGYEIYEASSKTKSGTDALKVRLMGQTVVFCGHSGVGKTSLLRTLLQADVGRVNVVSEATGKGQHTTTGAVMIEAPGSSRWIDTPGVREFGLADVTAQTLSLHFPELTQAKCGQTGCLHLDEEGCQAHGLSRYPSYRRILESLLAGEN